MSQHDPKASRHAAIQLLKSQPAHLAGVIDEANGYHIVDVGCTTPKCGVKIAHYLVQKPGSVADDLNVKRCSGCGARGSMVGVPAFIPAEDAKAKE
jgi:hypothetical protein